jgi:branched-chain amino acid transport system substrate-binding protein
VTKIGGKSWYFITADFSFGQNLEKDTSAMVLAAGGKVLGASRHPAFQGVDFSSFILSAQQSGADVIGLANSSNDTVNSVKMANEFGVFPKQKLAALLMQISDVHGLTLDVAKGLLFTDGWYWDLNDETRAFTKKFHARAKRYPGMVQAGTYSTTLQYLKAVEATRSDDADVVMAHLKKIKINDVFAKDGYIRADGRMVHDMYLAEVKTPQQSKGPWDYYNIRSVIPGEEAVIPLKDSKCALVKK